MFNAGKRSSRYLKTKSIKTQMKRQQCHIHTVNIFHFRAFFFEPENVLFFEGKNFLFYFKNCLKKGRDNKNSF